MSQPTEEPQKPQEVTPGANNYYMSCPVCGDKLIQEKCKVVCRSETCVYLIVMNCSEF